MTFKELLAKAKPKREAFSEIYNPDRLNAACTVCFCEPDGSMRHRCIELAIFMTPIEVTRIHFRKSLSGVAYQKDGLLCAPRPITRKALYIYLHECAHFVLHSRGRKARHLEEMEAERWAHEKMRENDIPVPKAMTKSAKDHVARKVAFAKKCGAKKIHKIPFLRT